MQQPSACVTCGAACPPRRKYCSNRCMYRRPNKPRTPYAVLGKLADCAVCGEQFYANRSRTTYCSRRCSNKNRVRSGAKCEWRCALVSRICDECGDESLGRSKRRFCGERCATRWWGRAKYKPTPERTYSCEQCGSVFTRSGRHGSPRHCSRKCYEQSDTYKDMRHRHNHNRRIRLQGGERVYRSRIYERDGWICQLCHKKVDKALKHPDPMSASLDHIIPAADPLATHEPRNVQLAHLHCNELRREVGPAQLILFGEIAA